MASKTYLKLGIGIAAIVAVIFAFLPTTFLGEYCGNVFYVAVNEYVGPAQCFDVHTKYLPYVIIFAAIALWPLLGIVWEYLAPRTSGSESSERFRVAHADLSRQLQAGEITEEKYQEELRNLRSK